MHVYYYNIIKIIICEKKLFFLEFLKSSTVNLNTGAAFSRSPNLSIELSPMEGGVAFKTRAETAALMCFQNTGKNAIFIYNSNRI